MSEKVESTETQLSVEPLSEREMAIARGENPDVAVQEPEPAQDAVVATEGDGGGGKEAAETGDWKAGVKEAAAKYGIGDGDLEAFQNADQFRVFTSLLDKRATTSAKPVEPVKAAETPVEAGDELPELDLKVFEEGDYSPETVALVKHLKAAQEKLSKFEPELTRLQQDALQRQVATFHGVVDTLEPELFGRTVADGKRVALGAEESARRDRLWKAAGQLEDVLISSGQEVPDDNELLRRAADMEFGSELRALEQKRAKARVEEQSRRRRPVAGGARSPKAAVPSGDKPLHEHPDIVKMWDRFQEENGR